MVTKGSPSHRYKWRTSPKQLEKSYQVRLEAQFGDAKAKARLAAYNKRILERKMEANEIEWQVDGRKFNRYRMMDYIVNRVSNGEPLPLVCDQKGMPSMQVVYAWYDNHPEFERDMRRADEIRGHRLGEEAIRIALETDRENVAADKLKVETLGKAAARMNSRFQDKQINVAQDEYANMTMDQLKARIIRMVEANPTLLSSVPGHPALGNLGGQETQEPQPEPEIPTAEIVQSDTED